MTSKSAVDLITSSAKDSSVAENCVDGKIVVIKEEASFKMRRSVSDESCEVQIKILV